MQDDGDDDGRTANMRLRIRIMYEQSRVSRRLREPIGEREEGIPRSLDDLTDQAGRRVVLRTRLALGTGDGTHHMLHDEVLRRFVADFYAARRARVRGLRGRLRMSLDFPLDVAPIQMRQARAGQSSAPMCGHDDLRIVVRVGGHVLCKRSAEPVLEAVLAEGVSAREPGKGWSAAR